MRVWRSYEVLLVLPAPACYRYSYISPSSGFNDAIVRCLLVRECALTKHPSIMSIRNGNLVICMLILNHPVDTAVVGGFHSSIIPRMGVEMNR